MLTEYENDHLTGMDIRQISEAIYAYTSGYPYLVSRICMLLDEQILGKEDFETKKDVWSENGITEAVKILLYESNTLFDDMRKRIADYPELKKMLYAILFYGQSFAYNPDNFVIDIGKMFGFLEESNGQVIISNRIFETRIYNLFLSEEYMTRITNVNNNLPKNQISRRILCFAARNFLRDISTGNVSYNSFTKVPDL